MTLSQWNRCTKVSSGSPFCTFALLTAQLDFSCWLNLFPLIWHKTLIHALIFFLNFFDNQPRRLRIYLWTWKQAHELWLIRIAVIIWYEMNIRQLNCEYKNPWGRNQTISTAHTSIRLSLKIGLPSCNHFTSCTGCPETIHWNSASLSTSMVCIWGCKWAVNGAA